MFGRIKDLLNLGGGGGPDRLHQAAAALLVQAAMMDGVMQDSERLRILSLLRRHFALAEAAAECLLTEARQDVAGAVDLFGFTRVINESFAPAERVSVIEMLWEVAYADGHLDDYEANLVRRVGGLLFVPDYDTGEARKRALARLGLDGGLA